MAHRTDAGRKVRERNQLARDESGIARQHLYGILGERDPVKVMRAIGTALAALDKADCHRERIEEICAANALRNPNGEAASVEDERP